MKSKKIVSLLQLKKKLLNQKLKTALVHGVFDILHVGHKRYFEEAKAHADLLIVSITTDKFVNKGPTRPIFNQNLRAELLASFEVIDYVILSDNETAVNLINNIKPNFYVKGKDYKNLKNDISKNILKEKKAVEKHNGKLLITDDISFSSSNIINNFYKPETILNELKKLKLNTKVLSKKCLKSLLQISKLKIAIIGEIIFDEYVFSSEMDKPSKENIHVVNFKKKIEYLGGVVAVAKNLSEFCGKIEIFSTGKFTRSQKNFIFSTKKNYKNINIFLENSGFQTIKKSRILDERNKKIFELYYKDGLQNYKESQFFVKNLKNKLGNYDLVIMCDFGHGFFNERIYKVILQNSKKLAINTQTNSDNRGFNLITKYKKANLICIDEPEIRLALSDSFSNLDYLSKKLNNLINFENLIITRGNSGIYVYKNNTKPNKKNVSLSAFELNPVDTIGAGDAVLGIASLLITKKSDIEVIAFLGNIFGALATKYLGHSLNIKKNDVLKAITYSLK